MLASLKKLGVARTVGAVASVKKLDLSRTVASTATLLKVRTATLGTSASVKKVGALASVGAVASVKKLDIPITVGATASLLASVGTFATPDLVNNISFETGYDGCTNWSVQTPATPRINTDAAPGGGSWCVQTTWTASTGGEQFIQAFAPSGVDHFWGRFWLRMNGRVDNPWKFWRIYDNAFNTNLGGFGYGNVGEVKPLSWSFGFENGSQIDEIGVTIGQVDDNAWHSLEWEYWRNGHPSGFPAVWFWWDGTPTFRPDGLVGGLGNSAYWLNGMYNAGERVTSISVKAGYAEMLGTLNPGNTLSGTCKIDRIAYSTLGRIGP